jgi:hypothetical protein
MFRSSSPAATSPREPLLERGPHRRRDLVVFHGLKLKDSPTPSRRAAPRALFSRACFDYLEQVAAPSVVVQKYSACEPSASSSRMRTSLAGTGATLTTVIRSRHRRAGAIGVALSVATDSAHVPIDTDLLAGELGEQLRAAGGVQLPYEVLFKTKHKLALDMITRAVEDGVPGVAVRKENFGLRESRARKLARVPSRKAKAWTKNVATTHACRSQRVSRRARPIIRQRRRGHSRTDPRR